MPTSVPERPPRHQRRPRPASPAAAVVDRVDPRGGRLLGSFAVGRLGFGPLLAVGFGPLLAVGFGPLLAVGFGALWVATFEGDELLRVDLSRM